MDRTALAAALDGMRLPQIVMSLRRATTQWITVLTYHRVANPSAAAMLDEGVVDVAPDQLERQLMFLRRWFDPIGLGELLAYVRGQGPLPPNPVLVTFDDGYRDNFDVALPILQRHGVRATFFIATDCIERRRPFWWDRVAFIIKSSARDGIELDYPEPMALPLASAKDRRAAIGRVQRLIKDLRGLDLEHLLRRLEDAAGVTLGSEEERRLADETLMTWQQVLELRRAGMDVQSHTRTHRVMQTLDMSELEEELRGSREELQAVLGEPVVAVSYPVGKSLGRTWHVRAAVRDAGYELGFTNGTGVNRTRHLDPIEVRRVSMDLALSEPLFRAMLAIPWLTY
jgi:peptidoglycan/xylan/chitin deacetylase (PgdA/CDA1 family)